MHFRDIPPKHLTFINPDRDSTLNVFPSTSGLLRLNVEDATDLAGITLDHTQAVAAALHMIACVLGEAAALGAERAIAPYMKVSKP
jgi:hypothetical protein